jgi:hypothetical protein
MRRSAVPVSRNKVCANAAPQNRGKYFRNARREISVEAAQIQLEAFGEYRYEAIQEREQG